jgi:hypothetical protein
MAQKKSNNKLRLPMRFGEAVSDFLKVKPQPKPPQKAKSQKK